MRLQPSTPLKCLVWSLSISQFVRLDLFPAVDGCAIAIGTVDGSVDIWDTTLWTPLATLGGHSGQINCLAFSVNGEKLASASADKSCRLWETTSYSPVAVINHPGVVFGVSFMTADFVVTTCSDFNTRCDNNMQIQHVHCYVAILGAGKFLHVRLSTGFNLLWKPCRRPVSTHGTIDSLWRTCNAVELRAQYSHTQSIMLNSFLWIQHVPSDGKPAATSH